VEAHQTYRERVERPVSAMCEETLSTVRPNAEIIMTILL
jgi:hypothetical protein